MNILLTCAGRRHYLATFFREALAQTDRIVGVDMDRTAPALQACDSGHEVSGVFSDNYLDAIKNVMIREKVDALFSLSDLEIGLLAKNRTELERDTGATLYVPSLDTHSVCADKWKTYQFANQLGLKVPATYLTVEGARSALSSGVVSLPFIVKPRWGSASIGLVVVNDPGDLQKAYEACEKAVRGSALLGLDGKQLVIIQEFVRGVEYGLDLLFGMEGQLIGFASKRKIAMRAGETDKAVMVEPAPFLEIVLTLSQAMSHRGNLDCDFIEHDGEFYLLEFNPRFGGGYPFTHLSGAKHVQMLVNEYKGADLPPYSYQVGKIFAKCDMLVEIPTC